MLDERLVKTLHVQSLREDELHAEREPHVLFQASTIGALLDGAYEGDVTFAELAEHGDLGLGTLNALDGEMIALDGGFFRADASGDVSEVDPGQRTPFAVLTWFEPSVQVELEDPLSHDDLIALMDDRLPGGTVACAVRIDGSFELVHARSVPRHEPPYPPLDEIAHEQHVFDFHDVEGTMVGFRFPSYAQGIELAGYHLHFVDAERRRGGHVLTCRTARVEVHIDHARDLHVELPPGIELGAAGGGADAGERIRRVEGDA